MTTQNNDVEKRYSAAHKAAIGKVAHHLGLAKAAHAKGMAFLGKAAGCMVKMHKGGLTDEDFKKAQGDLAGHISSAHDSFSAAGDHMDDMDAHLGKAMTSFGSGTQVTSGQHGGTSEVPSLSEMTEGSVPQYDADSEYGKLMKRIADGQLLTKEQVDAMIASATKNASLEAQVASLSKQVETLSRMPAGDPKVKIFDFDRTAAGGGNAGENTAKVAALLNGIDLNMRDEGDFTKAAGGVIANMIKNGPKFGGNMFGKPPMWDPSFHGRGGTGARN
jgi:hypothetical protein